MCEALRAGTGSQDTATVEYKAFRSYCVLEKEQVQEKYADSKSADLPASLLHAPHKLLNTRHQMLCFLLQKEEKVQEENADGKLTSLHPKKKIAFPLTERIQLSHNVFLFRFGLPSEEHTLGLPVGQHVFIYGKVRALSFELQAA